MINELRQFDYMKAEALKVRPDLQPAEYQTTSRIDVIMKQVITLISDAFHSARAFLKKSTHSASGPSGNPMKLFMPGRKLGKGDVVDGLDFIKAKAPNFSYSEEFFSPNKYIPISIDTALKDAKEDFEKENTKFYAIPFLIHGGGHIVQIFIDKDKKRIEYYDLRLSSPDHTTIQGSKNVKVRDLLNSINAQFFENTADILINKNKLQTDFHNCGVHVLDMIIKRLDGLRFDDVQAMANVGQIEKIRLRLATSISNNAI